jgi:hypothetical protein
MEEIKVSKFHITIHGDESVGIWDQRFELGPDFYFEDKEHLKGFIEKLQRVFKTTFGEPVSIETQEELDKINDEFEKNALEASKADENFVDESMSEEELKEEIKKDWSLDK